MASIINKIHGKDIKKYIANYKSCKISPACCTIQGKLGSLTLNLSAFDGALSCSLFFRRVSGNGLISVANNSYTIVSKISEAINIDISKEKIIDIVRPINGIGNIELISIDILSNSDTIPNDLKTILRLCKTYCISSVKGRFFANEGSTIECNGLTNVETNPKNMFTINGNTVKFLGLCEICNISVDNSSYENVEVLTESLKTLEKESLNNITLEKIQKNSVFKLEPNSNKNIINSSVILNNNKILISRAGSFNTILNNLQQDTSYLLILNAKNINGNGKFNISITNSNLKNHVNFIKNSTIEIPFKTFNINDFNLIITRNNSCSGKIEISDIIISQIGQFNKKTYKNTSSTNIEYFSKQFATIKPDYFETNNKFNDITGIIYPITFSANNWVNKIKNLFPNLKIKSNILDIKNNYDNYDLLISDLNLLKPSNKIWLEEFVNNNISDKNIKILKDAKVVVSSSLPNVQFLRNTHNINMLYMPKNWPYIKYNKTQDKYILYFNRDQNITNELIKNYNKGLPQLVIVGMRGNFPSFIKAYGEYLDYKTLFNLIINSSAIIDLPKCTHYMSAVLDLAFISNIPIITSNQWLSISKPKTYMVRSKLKNNDITFDFDDVINNLQNIEKNKILINESYNLNIYSSIKTIMDY